MILDPFVVDPDDVRQCPALDLRAILRHGGSSVWGS
jgi:hypothetical protein